MDQESNWELMIGDAGEVMQMRSGGGGGTVFAETSCLHRALTKARFPPPKREHDGSRPWVTIAVLADP